MPAFHHQNNFWLKLERGHEARGYVITATFLSNANLMSQGGELPEGEQNVRTGVLACL
jgi:hypothetical protein